MEFNEKKYKFKRKKYKQKKKKRGGGINPFEDGFKFLYSIGGNQYRKSTRWKEKKIMQWWILQLLK